MSKAWTCEKCGHKNDGDIFIREDDGRWPMCSECCETHRPGLRKAADFALDVLSGIALAPTAEGEAEAKRKGWAPVTRTEVLQAISGLRSALNTGGNDG